MSEIRSMPAGHNLTDDDQSKCWRCWSLAKQKFFGTPRRRGRTLNTVYSELVMEYHNA